MSVEFNSTINEALENAKQRRLTLVGRSEKLLAQDPNYAANLEASGLSNALSEEDIINAMKTSDDTKRIENKFLGLHRVINRQDKKDENVSDVNKNANQKRRTEAITDTQNKMTDIKQHSEIMQNIQNRASSNLTSYRTNLFK